MSRINLNKVALSSLLFFRLISWVRKFLDAKPYFFSDITLGRFSNLSPDSQEIFYVIGSGPTVNELRNCDWDNVGKGFSIGLNDFIFHKFQCDLYSIEYFRNSSFTDLVLDEILRSRRGPILLKPPMKSTRHQNVQQRLSNAGIDIISVPVVPSHAKSESEFLRELDLFQAYRDRYGQKYALLDRATSAFRAAQFGLSLGFKTICFIGVDLTLPGYYWQGTPLDTKISRAREAHLTTSNFRNLNTHTSLSLDQELDSMDVFRLFNDNLSKIQPGVKLVSWSTNSGLASFMNSLGD